MTITGDGLNLNTNGQQIFQVFLQLLIPFSATETIELGKLNGVVSIQNQTQVVGEISAVNDQVYTLRGVTLNLGGSFK
jgi:hypothetical protein